MLALTSAHLVCVCAFMRIHANNVRCQLECCDCMRMQYCRTFLKIPFTLPVCTAYISYSEIKFSHSVSFHHSSSLFLRTWCAKVEKHPNINEMSLLKIVEFVPKSKYVFDFVLIPVLLISSN